MKEQFRIKRGIRWKLVSTMIGLIISLVAILTFLQISSQKRILEKDLLRRISLMRENLIDRGKSLSDNLARQAENGIASFNLSNVTEIISKSVDDHKEMNYAILMDYSRRAYIHTLRPELEQELLSYKEDWYAANQSKATINEYNKDNNILAEFIVPINVSTEPWGVLRLGFSLNSLNKEIISSKNEISKQTKDIITGSIITSIIFIFIGAGIVFIISNRLSKPIEGLTKSARELAKGNFSFADNIKVKSGDETGILANAFIEMARNLKISHETLENYNRTLEQRVEARTIELKETNEKLQELDKMKTDFLSTVSHELRTPLALVLGFARIISKRLEEVIFPLVRAEDNKVKKAINQVKGNVDIIMLEGTRLTDLINDVLDISKMEAGKIEWEMKWLSMDKVVKRAISTTSYFFEQNKLKLIEDIDYELPLIMGDEDRLIQVVINLISNAVKFTEKGSITCRVKNINNEIIVSIIDTGMGILEVEKESIFEKFKQISDTHTHNQRGTGLGLAICKQIVLHHGGRIWVESELGKGSTLTFAIPCEKN